MSELRGRLHEFGLAALVRFLTESGRSGSLNLWQAGWSGQIVFNQGQLVAAVSGEERGLDALELIALALVDGEFVYCDGTPGQEHNLQVSASQVQLELERLLSGPARRTTWPPLRSVPRPALQPGDHLDREVALSCSELALLLDVNGRRCIEEILHGREPLRALRAVSRLTDLGIIELHPPDERDNGRASPSADDHPPAAPRSDARAGVANGSVNAANTVAAPSALPPLATPAAEAAGTSATAPLDAAGPGAAAPRRRARMVRDVVRWAVLALIGVFALRSVLDSVRVEGQSMLPGLQADELLLINRAAYFHVEGSPLAELLPTTAQGATRYLFGGPQRDDVVVFDSLDPPGMELVKRIIGLPGETVRIDSGGRVLVNERVLDEAYVAATSVEPDGYPADGQPIRVPDDSYFVLGDSRAASLDSRQGWFVRVDQLVGRAWLSYWPPTAWAVLAQPPVAEVPASIAPATAAPLHGATPTPEPATPTPEFVGLSPAAVTATAAPTARTLLAGLVRDQPGWPSNPSGAARLDGPRYRLTARQPTKFVAVDAPLPDSYADVTVSATFSKVGGPPGGGYGIIVRDQGPGPRDGVNQSGRFYVAEVGDRGEVGLWRRDEDHWVDLLPWVPSDAVHQGSAANELRLSAAGDHLALVVNGVQAGSVIDAALTSGRVGVFVGGDLNDIVLDDFTVQVPPPGPTP